VLPNFRSLGSVQSASTNRFGMPGLQSHSNTDSLNYNASKQQITEK
jgi:hypothetical protein